MKNEYKLPDPKIERQKTLDQIKQSHKLALEYFQQNKLEEAEQELVKVLRPTLSKSSMKNLYVKTKDVKAELLDAMYHLGCVYLKNNSYLEHHAKAAAIFQYCAGFSKKHQITLKLPNQKLGDHDYFIDQAYEVEKQFLESIKKCTGKYVDSREKIILYQSELEYLRIETSKKLQAISDLTVNEIAKRTEAVEKIYQDCTSFFVNHDEASKGQGLVQELLSDCYEYLGKPPCEYVIIGLGSISGGKMTPYSDLEFAILIDKDTKDNKEYFRNLSKLLHIKVINFGETPLRMEGIESLNNFRTADEADEWFWDDVINAGFSFDGAHWHACKLPLGRQGYKAKVTEKNQGGIEVTRIIEKEDYELILTPQEMAEFQKEEVSIKNSKNWFESDMFLVHGIRSVMLIDGNQQLLDSYYDAVTNAVDHGIVKKRSLGILQNDINEFQLKLGHKEEGKLFDVKKDIYRLGDRVIDVLADYYSIIADKGKPILTVWNKIDKMYQNKILSLEGAQHLKEAISIAVELRLSTYCNNKSQSEGISTYVPAVEHLNAEQKHKLIKETFHFKNTSILHHFYYVMLRLQFIVKFFCDQEYHELSKTVLKNFKLFDDSNYNKGMVHARFLEYDQALKYMEAAKDKQPGDLGLLYNLYFLYSKTARIDGAIIIGEEILKLAEDKYKENPNHPNVASSYNNLGEAYRNKGKYNTAIECFRKALKIYSIAYESKLTCPGIAASYNNLGLSYSDKGKYEKAIKYYEKALKLYGKAYESNLMHPDSALGYNSLGNAYRNKGEYEKAIKYYEKALENWFKAHEKNPNHPNIANSYNNLGTVYASEGKYELGIKYFNHALDIYLKAYTQSPKHPDIAKSYDNLGEAYRNKSKYDQAIEYHDKALKIYENVYKKSSIHPDVASSYNGLGNAYLGKGEYELAIKNYQLALQTQLEVYEENPNHPDIAKSHNNLGNAYLNKGEYEQAIDYYEKALENWFKAYEKNPNHPNIATSYNNLGNAYSDKGECELAIDYYEKSLAIYKKAYEKTPNHPDIAMSYNNLGNAYRNKGEYGKAIEYCKKSLAIQLVAYEKNPNHPDIASSYNNLGLAYSKKGEYEKAIDYYKKSLAIQLVAYEKNPNHPFVAKSHNALGEAYTHKGEYETAIKYFLQALEIRQKAYDKDPNHPDIAGSFNNLGAVHIYKGDYDTAIKYLMQALKIRQKAYANSLNHPDIADSYNNLGSAYDSKGEYELAIKNHQLALQKRLVIYKENPNHPDIASSYNNLGSAYDSKGKYELAIKYHKKSLAIRLVIHKENSNHPDIAGSYNNLGLVYIKKGEYEQACVYAKKLQDISGKKVLYYVTLLLLGNNELLANKHDAAREYYKQIDSKYEHISFDLVDFINLQFQYVHKAYDSDLLMAAINCQLVLVTVDPDLEYANHYHNLACFYAACSSINDANITFKNALTHPNAQVTAGLHTEYSRFLIINKDSNILTIDSYEISTHLYSAINSANIDSLNYRKIEQDTLCNVLQYLIKEKNTTISINPKVLAYYLLITNPEYITGDDTTVSLLESFSKYCYSLQDEISFKLLLDAFKFSGYEEVSIKYFKHATLIEQIDKIIEGKLKLDDKKCVIKLSDIQKHVDTLEILARNVLMDKNFIDLHEMNKQILKIYEKILSDHTTELNRAVNNLATSSMLNNDFNTFCELKLKYDAKVDIEIVKALGQDVNQIIASDNIITNSVQNYIQQQRIEQAIETGQNTESEVNIVGEDVQCEEYHDIESPVKNYYFEE